MRMKWCSKCEETKPLSEYSLSRSATATRKAVYRSRCKTCQATAARGWFAANPQRSNENRRRWNLANNYGMSVKDYDALRREQAGVCAICGQAEGSTRQGKPMRLSVDHDHESGQVRGLLCDRCNRALGLLGDNAAVLRRAISYLNRTNTRKVVA